jgi:MarR family 2-MHQ and catechol resistance regulon transcriptional repressor
MAESTNAKRTRRALDAYRYLRRAAAKLAGLHEVQMNSFGLTLPQFAVLETLLHDGPATLTQIAERTLCSQSNATVVTANCERRGWVVRRDHASDRRKLTVKLTTEGRRLAERVYSSYAKVVRAQMCTLSYAQQTVLGRLCQKLEEGDGPRFLLEMVKINWEEWEGTAGEESHAAG